MRTGRYRLSARTSSLEDSAAVQGTAVTGFVPEHIGVAELLGGLRPEYRQVMELLYLRGYTQQEAAVALEVPLGTVKTWSVGARRQLHKLPL